MTLQNSDRAKALIPVSDVEGSLKETRSIASRFLEDTEIELFDRIFKDIELLFMGEYPGYRSSNTKYHDFEHTFSVVLATARLIQGCSVDGLTFVARDVLLTLIAALLHDVGLIQDKDDQEGSGAKYTVGHEERSIAFLKEYLADKGFAAQEIETGAKFIRCTILSLPPGDVSFALPEHQKLGYIVGTADLLAQMADRLYLEKLLLLYKEFEEASLPGFDSELELLQKTKDFFEVVAQKRLHEDLGGVCRHMRSHFKSWMDIDRDLYNESIKNHINYLESLTEICGDSLDCYLENLRRGGIARESQGPVSPDRKK
ncbi:MAG: HD domain-containing protein [Desulfobacterales bacterium]|nr:HD domain-containing protein [Desulfobacterales bacterium]